MIIPQELKNQFRTLVNNRCGLYFKDYDLRDLENAISQRIEALKIDSPAAYYNLLSFSERKEDEFRELLNILTVNHTYFFRNEPQFKVLKEKILPEIISGKLKGSFFSKADAQEKPVLRIWSAGCSTGEEPYSIAMIMRELIPDIENWDIQIIASDASENALAKARKGVYSSNSVAHVSQDYLKKHFSQEVRGREKRYVISEDIKRMISFAFFNLMDEDYPRGFDIVFCRNVVMYFELETIVKVMNKIRSSLFDQGYLFIGYAETLQFMPDKFKMVADEEAIYYLKAEAAEHVLAQEFAFQQELDLERVLKEISLKEVHAELAAEDRAAETPKNIENIMAEAVKLSRLKEYSRALELLEQVRSFNKNVLDPYYLSAEIFINYGKSKEARKILNQALAIDPLFAPAHYLLGCMYLEESALEEAKVSLKRSLFIDKDFLLAHFYIAQAYRNEGRINDAIREYRNTLKVLSKRLPEDIIPFSGGFNAATLLGVCRDNIERLKVSV
jgi:chemotaxis protein methyltransferase CheR